MDPPWHIFCVPSPIAGHTINALHASAVLARLEFCVHVLVLSGKKSKRWLESTGEPPDSNVTLEVLADGKWEDWVAQSQQELLSLVGSSEFTTAVEAAVMGTQETTPPKRCIAMLYSGLMSMLGNMAVRRGLKPYLLMPVPYYYPRLASCHIEGEPLSTTYRLNGIGGSEHSFEAQLNDVAELTSPFFYRVLQPVVESCAGMIFTNSNIGIEGDEFEQPLLPAPSHAAKATFMIGPCLPLWFEDAADESIGRSRHLRQSRRNDECLRFLDRHPEKSVVYVTFGSRVELEQWQAEVIIDSLRKHGVPWILVFRNDAETAKTTLLKVIDDDGIVTPWAPQLEVLTHAAIRCVISHGGFATLMEGIIAGQCFILSPVDSDQFLNSKVMANLGISLGTIAENTYLPVPYGAKPAPVWRNDSGIQVKALLDHVFGTEDGRRDLQQARKASLALRRRIKNAKEREGTIQVDALCKHMASGTSTDGLQRLFPSFVMGPW